MNLKHVNDHNLIELAEKNRHVEVRVVTDSLHYLREIETRRLFSKLGYKSIFEFATTRLKHSEDEACRRISAMRLLKELPQIEEKIISGELTLTHLNQAQTLFRREAKQNNKLSESDKIKFLSRIEGKSKRETEQIVAAVSPEVHIPDRVRAISQTQIQVQFSAEASLEQKFEELRGALAHTHPNISLGELNHWLCDFALTAIKAPAPARAKKQAQTAHKPDRPMSKAAIKREIWKRDAGQCQNCKSKYAVEIDHIHPKALGGQDTLANLRLLCRNCNQRAAVEIFGRKKMGSFVSSPTVHYRV